MLAVASDLGHTDLLSNGTPNGVVNVVNRRYLFSVVYGKRLYKRTDSRVASFRPAILTPNHDGIDTFPAACILALSLEAHRR
ncbi:hypothetical protein ACVW0W_006970 [Bradyrhizobium sp. USDA 4469]